MTVRESSRKLKQEDRRKLAHAVSDALVRQIIDQMDLSQVVKQKTSDDPVGLKIAFEFDLGGKTYLITAEPQSNRRSVSCLSPREREIVRLVARGLPNKAIAQLLDISLWTVATHVRRVFAKLGVGSRAQMVAKILLSDARDTTSSDEGGVEDSR